MSNDIDSDFGSDEDAETLEPDMNDDEGSDEGSDDEYTPPSKSEFAKFQRQLKRANAQVQKLKEATRAVPTDDDKDDLKAEGFTEAESKYKPLLVHAEARAQLAAMGLKGDAKKFIRLLDLADIDVDDDGGLSGLEEQLDGFKADFPELFDARRIKGDKRTRADASDRSPGTPKTSTADALADLLRGKKEVNV